jgi:hypothetical protein
MHVHTQHIGAYFLRKNLVCNFGFRGNTAHNCYCQRVFGQAGWQEFDQNIRHSECEGDRTDVEWGRWFPAAETETECSGMARTMAQEFVRICTLHQMSLGWVNQECGFWRTCKTRENEKLITCRSARHVGMWGNRGIPPLILNLGTMLRWVVRFTPRPIIRLVTGL